MLVKIALILRTMPEIRHNASLDAANPPLPPTNPRDGETHSKLPASYMHHSANSRRQRKRQHSTFDQTFSITRFILTPGLCDLSDSTTTGLNARLGISFSPSLNSLRCCTGDIPFNPLVSPPTLGLSRFDDALPRPRPITPYDCEGLSCCVGGTVSFLALSFLDSDTVRAIETSATGEAWTMAGIATFSRPLRLVFVLGGGGRRAGWLPCKVAELMGFPIAIWPTRSVAARAERAGLRPVRALTVL